MNDKKLQHWQKQFFLIWSGQGVSIFTSAVIQMALVWYLTDRTGSAAVLTTATLIGYLPQVILGPFIGTLIDRYNRKKIMVISDLFIALISLSIVVSGTFGEIPVSLIMVVLFLRSIGSTFHNPSLQAVTPLFVPDEELTRYAGYSQGVESASMLLSPMAAAALYGFLKLNQIILIDVFGALFAVIMLCFVTIPDIKKTASAEQPHLLTDMKKGLDVIRNERGLMGLILISGLYAIIYFPIGTLFPLICIGYFQGSYVASGIVETVFSVGMLLGSLTLGAIGNRLRKMGAISFSITLYGSGLLITGLLTPQQLPIFAVLSLFMGFSLPFYRGVKLSVFQSKVAPEYLGRVLSLSTSIQSLAMPIGLIFSGLFAELMGIETFFLLCGVLTLLLAAVTIFTRSIQHCCD